MGSTWIPGATHVVYIPFIIVIGMALGFVLGRKAGIREGEDAMLGHDNDDDLI